MHILIQLYYMNNFAFEILVLTFKILLSFKRIVNNCMTQLFLLNVYIYLLTFQIY